ncbi:MAG: hypothetical protein II874_03350 [Bacteroidales bacterium]|nr:hypothetical protein [Bacteroidales bacterium]
MKPFIVLSALCMAAISCAQAVPETTGFIGNPYMPLWEHVPDGEPRVFEDPDQPGKYRVYVTGSHDTRFDSYCGQDDRQWSAPVEDLSAWRDEGPVFTYCENGYWSTIYAPDLVEVNRRDDGTRKYYLYPHALMHTPMVCVSDRPDGPFTVLNVKDGQLAPGSIMGFDPGVLVEPVDDPSDPDYGRGFRAFGAWGIIRSSGTELDPDTMYSPRYGSPDWPFLAPSQTLLDFMDPAKGETEQQRQFRSWGNVREGESISFPAVAEGESLEGFSFFEASSFRKVGNKYIYLYSGHSGPDYGLPVANATLRYAYSDSPRGPWKSGGILVDARGPVLSRDGSHLETGFDGNNTHGSLAEINGQWYVFYHRAPRGFGFARQAMVAPVAVEADEKPVSEGGAVRITAYDPYKGPFTVKAADGWEYKGAEVTSEGFFIYGLPPYRYYSAGYACYMSRPSTMQDNWDVWDNRMDIAGVQSGDILGYKYFGFGGLSEGAPGLPAFEGVKKGNRTVFNLFLAARSAQAFKVGVWIDGPWEGGAWDGTKVGEVEIPAGASADVTRYSIPVGDAIDGLTGKHALFLVAEGPSGEPLCDIMGFGFTKKGRKMEFPVPPVVRISVGGQALEMPAHPVWTTDLNGLTDNTFYEVAVPEGVSGKIAVKAPKSVKVAIDQDARLVRCTYRGKTKTFTLK